METIEKVSIETDFINASANINLDVKQKINTPTEAVNSVAASLTDIVQNPPENFTDFAISSSKIINRFITATPAISNVLVSTFGAAVPVLGSLMSVIDMFSGFGGGISAELSAIQAVSEQIAQVGKAITEQIERSTRQTIQTIKYSIDELRSMQVIDAALTESMKIETDFKIEEIRIDILKSAKINIDSIRDLKLSELSLWVNEVRSKYESKFQDELKSIANQIMPIYADLLKCFDNNKKSIEKSEGTLILKTNNTQNNTQNKSNNDNSTTFILAAAGIAVFLFMKKSKKT